MRYLFIILGVLLSLVGLFLVIMFTGTSQTLGLALIGISCYLGILARIDQADVQHKDLLAAVRSEPPPKSRMNREMDQLGERARQ